jgi:hypothetical protein
MGGIMKYPMTPKRGALYKEIGDLFDTLSPEDQAYILQRALKRVLTVTSGTAEPVAADQPVLRIVKTPATGRA